MHSTLPSNETLYAALIARDAAYDGHAFVGVTTTGVFCRLTCAARKPRFENTRFYASIPACLEAGFRPCLRCRPLDPLRAREPIVATLLDQLDRDPGRSWTEQDLIALQLDPSTVRRAFRRQLGMTFLDMARFRRLSRGMDRLVEGAPVIEAQLDAGYESSSGFRGAIARLIGDCPAGLKGSALLKADWVETPLGAMLAIADEDALHLLEFSERKALPAELTRLRRRTGSAISFGRSAPIVSVKAELRAYFGGCLVGFSTPIIQHGSAFTRRVWQELAAIPPGTSRSYAEIAAAIGHPAAVRAVARANGANSIAIVVPCHRVIGSDGALTGYGGGLWRKRWLIEHEQKFRQTDAV
ncbi:MAG: trifunctional transcriptional activator/DNA repair protein Ada/methylated-DNA--[protein]-cysteine S-methyltransferase [Betaproteobacteria bacterium]|jgi:AraC family transcriptional regulator of adaptative response/methylated-DNA-[protein]-cysteine methyltransferase|nr:trifunctional transcriptional activator/DNA repair protein Ada/methylated-DNA--[protein]-cysteine S-methyltransferase [Betaproteobacteria bacterium]